MRYDCAIDEQISFRLPAAEDDEAIFAVVEANREHLSRWMPWACECHDLDDVRENHRQVMRAIGEDRWAGGYIIFRGELVGRANLENIERVDDESNPLRIARGEIGYWLIESAQGHGIMTRCVRALLAQGFEVMGLDRIIIKAEPANQRSCAVAERVGMTLEGTHRQVCHFNGRPVDHNIYAMLAEQWSQRSADSDD